MDGQKRSYLFFLRTGLLILFFSYFYSLSLNSQNKVNTSLSSSSPVVGEDLILIFSLPNNLLSSLIIEDPSLPEGLITVEEPTIYFNELENQTKITFRLTSKEAGFKKIPSFIFKEGSLHEFKSESLDVVFSINDSLSKKRKEPFSFFLISKMDKVMRVNQTSGLALIVRGDTSLGDHDLTSFNFNFPSSIGFLEVPLFYDLRSNFFEGRNILERPLKNWIIYFKEEGIFNELNLEMDIKGENYSLPLGDWQVLPLDSLVNSGAIGAFDITTGIKRESSYVEITIVLSGEGNFNSLKFPELNVNQGEIIGFIEDNSLRPTENGFKGSLFKTYTIKSNQNSQVQAWTSPFIYLNNFTNTIKKIESISFFENDLNLNSKFSLKEKEDRLIPLSLDEISSLKFNFLFSNALWYLIFLPIFIPPLFFVKNKSIKITLSILLSLITLFLVFIFWMGFKQVEKSQSILISSQELISLEGSQENMISKIDNILSFSTPSYYKANLFYNKAIYLYELEEAQQAIYYLYLSLKEAPLHIPSQKAIFTISQSLGQSDIINFSYFYWLNYLFIGMVITLNLYSFFFFFLESKRVFRFFLLFFLSFIFVLQGFFFIKLSFDLKKPLGVLTGDSIPLLQIPSLFASSWIFTKGGIPVYILDDSSSFYRVSLPSGVQAWVGKKMVREI